MASTYSTNLRLELMGTGDQAGTWGTVNNRNLGTLLEEAICGVTTQAMSDSTTTITLSDGATSAARHAVIELTGTLTANRALEVPAKDKTYYIYNNTTGGFTVTVRVTGQTGVAIPNGKKKALYCDSTDVREAITDLSGSATAGGNAILYNTYSGPSFTGTTSVVNIGIGTGSAAQPAFRFTADADTGFFWSSENTLGFAAGGVLRGTWGTAGLAVTGTLTTSSDVAFAGGMIVAGTTVLQGNVGVGGGLNVTGNAVATKITAMGALPPGAITDFAGSTAPAGWLLCYGQAVSRTTYAQLFTAIGTTYGTGDGATTFNVPDCRGRIGVGKDDMGGTRANRIQTHMTSDTLGAAGGSEYSEAHNHSATSTQGTHAHSTVAHSHTSTGNGSDNLLGRDTSGAQYDISTGASNIFSQVALDPETVIVNAASAGAIATVVNTAFIGGGGNLQPSIIFNKIIYAGA